MPPLLLLLLLLIFPGTHKRISLWRVEVSMTVSKYGLGLRSHLPQLVLMHPWKPEMQNPSSSVCICLLQEEDLCWDTGAFAATGWEAGDSPLVIGYSLTFTEEELGTSHIVLPHNGAGPGSELSGVRAELGKPSLGGATPCPQAKFSTCVPTSACVCTRVRQMRPQVHFLDLWKSWAHLWNEVNNVIYLNGL